MFLLHWDLQKPPLSTLQIPQPYRSVLAEAAVQMTHILARQEADNKSVHVLGDGCIIGLNEVSKTKF